MSKDAPTREAHHLSKRAGRVQFHKRVSPAIIGNAFEFFDFTTYALFAVMIGKAFFPSSDSQTELLLAVAVFGVGFVTRPLGSLVIGSYADRAGRRPAMLLTVWLMGAGTALLAITPSYNSIGLAAPIMIVLARLLQGAALGGEFGPNTAYLFEIAPSGSRGLYTSCQPASQGLAMIAAGLIGFVLSTFLSQEDLEHWGWRVPFLLGLGIIPVGIVLRRNMSETAKPTSATRVNSGGKAAPPRASLIAAICAQIGFGTVALYLSSYMTTFALTELRMPPHLAFGSAAVVGFSVMSGSLAGGFLADRFSRQRIISVPRYALILITVPLFWFATKEPGMKGLVLISVTIPFLAMLSSSAALVAILEVLPNERRSGTLAISYAVVVSAIGGTTQFLIAWLLKITGSPMIPAYFLIFTCIIAITTMPLIKIPRTYKSI